MIFAQWFDGEKQKLTAPAGADFALAVRAAQIASRSFIDHKKVSFEKRQSYLAAFLERLNRDRARYENLLINDLGYSARQAQDEVRHALATATRSITAMDDLGNPIGPCLIYGSLSSPLLRVCETVLPALTSRNSVVLLAAPEASSIYGDLAEKLVESGFAPSLITVISTRDAEALETLASHPSLRAIHFAGHFYEGEFLRNLAFDFSKTKKYFFGGRNPSIFLYDAPLDDLENLVPQVLRYHLKGEERSNRWFVQEKNFAEFTARVRSVVERLGPADLGFAPSETYQQRYSEQMKSLKQERGWMDITVANAQAGTTGAVAPRALNEALNQFLPPQIAIDFNNCSPWHQAEVLGPVLTITRFKTSQEAIKFANTTQFASGASVFSANREKALDIARQLIVPRLAINSLVPATNGEALRVQGFSGFGTEIADREFFKVRPLLVD